MKILLIQSPNYSGSDLDNYLGGSTARLPQLGLLYLAACIRERHDVKILDLNLLQSRCRSAEELFQLVEQEVETFAPQVVGFYTMANVYPWIIACCQRVKARFDEPLLILGGEQATLTAADSMNAFPAIDAIVRGEGETTLPLLLERLENGETLDGLCGLSFRKDGEVIHNADRAMESDLDRLPLPAYACVPPLAEYQPEQPILRASILTSRGCPYNCKFCSVQTFWRRQMRFRSCEKLIEELRYLRATVGAGFIDFADDTFTLDHDRTQKFCRQMMLAKLDLEWFCRSRPDRVNAEILQNLRQAGCTMVFYGAESGSQAMLNYIGKDISKQQILTTVRETAAAGIKPILSFIYGYPDETAADLEASLALARRCLEEGAYWTSFQRLTALPGTPLADRIGSQFGTSGAYVGGSKLLLQADFLEQIKPTVLAHPHIFPSYFSLQTSGFRNETHLQETFNALAVRYGLGAQVE